MNFLLKAAPMMKSFSSGAPNVGNAIKVGVIDKNSKRLEAAFLKSADAYVNGLKTPNMVFYYKLGVTSIIVLIIWASIGFLFKPTEEEKEKKELTLKTGIYASRNFQAFVYAFLIMSGIQVYLRQKTLMAFTGENMIKPNLQAFFIPFVTLTILMKLGTSADAKISATVSSIVSIVILIATRKTYFVYKENLLEKEIFESLSGMFSECGTSLPCSHEHAGFLNAYKASIEPMMTNMSRFMTDKLDPIGVTKDLANRQSLQSINSFVG